MTSADVHLIISPSAGRGGYRKVLPGLQAALATAQRRVAVSTTTSLEHARQLASAAAHSGQLAVAMGGDGLVSAVAAGVSAAQNDSTMAIVPCGRGNDLARSLGITRSNASQVLLHGDARALDTGVANNEPFVCAASVGIDAWVVARANRSRLPARLVYPYATLASLRQWIPMQFTIESDGAVHHIKGYTVVVANAPYFGGGMKIAPNAELADGQLDVVVIGDLTKAQFARQAHSVMRGTHIGHPMVKSWRVKSVTISTDVPAQPVVDGELTDTASLSVQVRPQALRILSPPR